MCVLRAAGPDFDPDAFLADSSLEACRIFRKGEPPRDGKPPSTKSSMNIPVSDGSWSDLAEQVRDAERFLIENRAEIERLVSTAGVTGVCLDFPVEQRIGISTFTQTERFSAALVRLAGELGLELEISIYPCSDDEEEDGED